jgi:uncharacterized protein YaaQ
VALAEIQLRIVLQLVKVDFGILIPNQILQIVANRPAYQRLQGDSARRLRQQLNSLPNCFIEHLARPGAHLRRKNTTFLHGPENNSRHPSGIKTTPHMQANIHRQLPIAVDQIHNHRTITHNDDIQLLITVRTVKGVLAPAFQQREITRIKCFTLHRDLLLTNRFARMR